MYIASILTLIALLAAGYVFAKRRRTVAETRRQADPDSLRLIEQGEVIGFTDEHNTHAWLGLPFAQPPLGALRWKAPRPPLAWTGIRDALVFGAFAPQFANITVDAPEPTWGTVVGSEDCLTLNVFAPRFTREQLPQGDARLPVMVWIHGGANTVGTAASYTTLRNVAGQDRVVIISIQYRLGIFGWFSFPEMQEEGDSPEDRSGNFGTLDIIAALKWVKKNSAAFGGNPDNVTIYGESAGAQNVYTMLASPLARGLFHKAILQSPLTTTSTLEQAQNFSDDAIPGDAYSARELFCKWLVLDGSATDRQQAKTLLAHMSPADIRSYLHSRPAAQLLAVIRPGPLGFYPGPRLFRDGTVLPAASMLEVFSERERYNAVPLIIGSNRDEYKLFMTQNPDYVRLLFGKIPIIKDKVRYARHAAYMSDLWKAANVDEPATRMLMSGHQDVWVYRFDWDEQPAIPLIQPQLLLGAAHVLEMPFVFRDCKGEFDPFRSNTAKNAVGRQQVSDAMASYWAQFAYTAMPGRGLGNDLAAWQRWSLSPATGQLMVFDTAAGGGCRMVSHHLSVEQLKQRLSSDPAFAENGLERSQLYARMFRWSLFVEPPASIEIAGFFARHDASGTVQNWRPAYWP